MKAIVKATICVTLAAVLTVPINTEARNTEKITEEQLVAECICLFGLHQLEAFPVDTWVKKIEAQYYNGRFPQEKYAGYQGVMQQYLFAYIRNTEKAGKCKQRQAITKR